MEYPKALYIGDKVNHELAIVDDSQEENELRESGYVDFYDLAEEELVSETKGIDSTEEFNSAFVPFEKFNNVCEKLIQTETQLGAAQGERDFYIKENEKLQKELDVLQADHTPPETQAEPLENNYSSMTSDQIRAILDEKGIKWLKRDDKDTLLSYLASPKE